LTCSKKYKIQKKIREHHRKVRKDSRKKTKAKSRKDPGIPKLYPFKEEVLRQLEERKQREEEEKERRKNERFKEVNKRRKLELLQKDAQKRAKEFEKKQESIVKVNDRIMSKGAEKSMTAYYKEFKKVIEASDVIIEVLDARDPLGCRCPQIEELVRSSGVSKRIVLLLNKVDLVPKENVECWLKYLRNELPTVAFKASTQSQKQKLGQSKLSVETASKGMLSSTGCVGANTLLKLLGNYCRNKDIKTSITVGIVGFPNVGKSSVINSLKRSKACGVGSTPGFTKNMQEVVLDKHVKLLDSPGIVMASGSSDTQVILRNCVKIEQLDDLVVPVEAILRRCNKMQIMEKYHVPDYKDTAEFLNYYAGRIGKLRKGGIPDTTAAAKSILQDWNRGKISFYTIPPERKSNIAHESASIVQYWSTEFDLKAIEKEEQEDMQGLVNSLGGALVLDPGKPTAMEETIDVTQADLGDDESSDQSEMEAMTDDDDDDDDGDDDDADKIGAQTVVLDLQKKTNTQKVKADKDEEMVEASEENLQLNKARKKAFKKKKKQFQRKVARLESGTAMIESDKEDEYDFDVALN